MPHLLVWAESVYHPMSSNLKAWNFLQWIYNFLKNRVRLWEFHAGFDGRNGRFPQQTYMKHDSYIIDYQSRHAWWYILQTHLYNVYVKPVCVHYILFIIKHFKSRFLIVADTKHSQPAKRILKNKFYWVRKVFHQICCCSIFISHLY